MSSKMSPRSCQELPLRLNFDFACTSVMATSFGEAMIQSEVALTLVIQSEGTGANVTVTVPPHKCSDHSDITQTLACFHNIYCAT